MNGKILCEVRPCIKEFILVCCSILGGCSFEERIFLQMNVLYLNWVGKGHNGQKLHP